MVWISTSCIEHLPWCPCLRFVGVMLFVISKSITSVVSMSNSILF